MSRPDGYIPALGLDLLTPLYDPLLRWLMREGKFKRRLIVQAGVRAGDRVLDLGCGSGTLTVMIKRAEPNAEVVGLDGDENVLRIARARKRPRQGSSFCWIRGWLTNSLTRMARSTACSQAW